MPIRCLLLLLPLLLCPWVLLAVSCDHGSGDDDDTATDDDDTATDDDDTATDDDTDDDNDTTGGRALLSFEGTALAGPGGGGYEGTEHLVLVDDDGAGDELCRISCDLTWTAARDDCADCLWAYDLVRANATIVTDAGAGCAAFGHDAESVAAMNGTSVSYGFAIEYVGHADMLMIHDGSTWHGIAFATYDTSSTSLDYRWDETFVSY